MLLAGLQEFLRRGKRLRGKFGTLQQALQALRIESSSSTIATSFVFS